MEYLPIRLTHIPFFVGRKYEEADVLLSAPHSLFVAEKLIDRTVLKGAHILQASW